MRRGAAKESRRLPPLLHVIFDALTERGWAIGTSYFEDPEGNRYGTIEGAIEAQTFREIAAAGSPPTSSG